MAVACGPSRSKLMPRKLIRPENVCAPHCAMPAVAITAPVAVTTALEPSPAEAMVVSGRGTGRPGAARSATGAVPNITSRSEAGTAPEAVRATDRLIVRVYGELGVKPWTAVTSSRLPRHPVRTAVAGLRRRARTTVAASMGRLKPTETVVQG